MTLRNGHQLVATLRRVGLSESRARAVGKAFQLLRSPRELISRKRLANRLLDEVAPPVAIRDGYSTFTSSLFPHGDDAVATCISVADAAKSEYVPRLKEKGFLRTLLTGADLLARPELLAFATSPEMVAVVTEYLGAVPTLSDVRLWWSVPSAGPAEPSSSQLFHRDHEDYRQVKLFLNVREVGPESGPFTFLPASTSARVLGRLPHSTGRHSDEEILQHVSPTELVVLTGPVGSGALVDTCSCLHYGSRNESRERLVLMLHFVGYHSTFEPDQRVLTEEVRATMRGADPILDALMRTRPYGA